VHAQYDVELFDLTSRFSDDTDDTMVSVVDFAVGQACTGVVDLTCASTVVWHAQVL
jgi:hypothetical protein